jgi:hypothetical protein
MNAEMETKTITVGYTHPASDNGWTQSRIVEMARQGWQLAGRKNSEGLFGIGARTILTFRRPKHLFGRPIEKIKFETKVVSMGYCHPRETNAFIRAKIGEMALENWVCAGRTNHEGIFSLGACTRLIFFRPIVKDLRVK